MLERSLLLALNVCWSLSFIFQPLDVTDAKPDMSYLRLVKESELRKGDIIGSGAFGTVYKVSLLLSCVKVRMVAIGYAKTQRK